MRSSVTVTHDDLPDLNALRIAAISNGERVHDSSITAMISDVPALLGYPGGTATQVPGAAIPSGTRQGGGMAAKPAPRSLRPGITAGIGNKETGMLTNPVALEPL